MHADNSIAFLDYFFSRLFFRLTIFPQVRVVHGSGVHFSPPPQRAAQQSDEGGGDRRGVARV